MLKHASSPFTIFKIDSVSVLMVRTSFILIKALGPPVYSVTVTLSPAVSCFSDQLTVSSFRLVSLT